MIKQRIKLINKHIINKHKQKIIIFNKINKIKIMKDNSKKNLKLKYQINENLLLIKEIN